MPSTKFEVTNEGLRIARTDATTASILRALDYVWEQALIIGRYLPEIEALSEEFVSRFEKDGWEQAAEKIGISVEDLQTKLIPMNLLECTMSELRLLSLVAGVTTEYKVSPK